MARPVKEVTLDSDLETEEETKRARKRQVDFVGAEKQKRCSKTCTSDENPCNSDVDVGFTRVQKEAKFLKLNSMSPKKIEMIAQEKRKTEKVARRALREAKALELKDSEMEVETPQADRPKKTKKKNKKPSNQGSAETEVRSLSIMEALINLDKSNKGLSVEPTPKESLSAGVVEVSRPVVNKKEAINPSTVEVCAPPSVGAIAAVASGTAPVTEKKTVMRSNPMDEVINLVNGIKKELIIRFVGNPQINSEISGEVVDFASKYEALVLKLVGENERLRGRLDSIKESNRGFFPSSVLPPVPAPRASVPVGSFLGQPSVAQVSAVSAYPIGRPSFAQVASLSIPQHSSFKENKQVDAVETFSCRIKGGKNESSKEVQKKILNEIAPAVKGVRFHAVQPVKDGSVIIRAPSKKERDIIAKHGKFAEAGLTVKVVNKLGPKLVIRRVEKLISTKDFLEDLRKLNLARISKEEFDKEVKLVSGEWKTAEGFTSVIVECSSRIAEILLRQGRCYIKHFSFKVSPLPPVQWCYRCLSLDHMIWNCRHKESVCKRCGQSGHTERKCRNAIHCRDCDFRGLPAGHFMLSDNCPHYCAAVARVVARN